MKIRLLIALILLLVVGGPPCLPAQPPGETPLAVSFKEREVVVSGLAPGSRVAWLSLTSEPRRYSVRDVRGEGIASADGSGTARIDADDGVPPRSVWGVVDLASGAAAWAAPEGVTLEEVTPEGEGLVRDGLARLNRLRTRAVGLELLVVRPGKGIAALPGTGAWGLTVFDGSPSDRDETPDGEVAAALEEGRPLLDSPVPPDRLLPGDIVLGIDVKTYRVFTLRLPGGLEAAK